MGSQIKIYSSYAEASLKYTYVMHNAQFMHNGWWVTLKYGQSPIAYNIRKTMQDHIVYDVDMMLSMMFFLVLLLIVRAEDRHLGPVQKNEAVLY